ISVGMEDTLLVPVVRRADGLSIAGLARAVNDLATRARGKQLKADDLAGATFTVNNSGTFGTLFSYSVINPGQAGILTMEAIVQRPVAVDGMIGIKPMMYLCFSFDHRTLDGLQAARFLTRARKWLDAATAQTQIEVERVADPERLVADLEGLDVVRAVLRIPSFHQVFGKRVIVMGGGAQVGMVAQGAISEADRHNIRGERISVDTIPLVGEERLADAVRAVARLHRARALVLAGALVGGGISTAGREIREAGILVLSTNMAGWCRDATGGV